ncbi:hypothetical protein T484DRAFT_1869788 [Baffinella frigidus]|nr:hypothetical protein T484DRAFT_1869788 [Cryptophyta sp. CCMP2293]
MLQSVKTFVAARFSAAIPAADRPSALAASADSSAAPPTPSASGAAPPSPPERMAAGSDSSEARHGRISPCAANPGASVRNGDKCSASSGPTGEREQPSPAALASPPALAIAPWRAVPLYSLFRQLPSAIAPWRAVPLHSLFRQLPSASPDLTGEREQPSPAAPASPPALAIAPWRAVRSPAEQRRWQYQEARRRLGSGATHAALRVCINEIRAEPLPPPPSRRARGRRGGAKQRSRAAPPSVHVSKPSVSQRAPAIPGHQHAAEASAGKVRAALRALSVLQARDAAWQQCVEARRAAAAARLPPRDAHVSAWRVRAAALALQAGEARLRTIEEELATISAPRTHARANVRYPSFTGVRESEVAGEARMERLRAVERVEGVQDRRLWLLEVAVRAMKPLARWVLLEQAKTSASDEGRRLRGALKKVTFSSDQDRQLHPGVPPPRDPPPGGMVSGK